MYNILRRTLYLCFGLCLMCSFSGFVQEAGAEKKARWDLVPPEAKQLYKDWSDFMGQTSMEMVEADDPAPEIKPGMVITPDNAADFPNLKKLLPDQLYKRISSRDTYAYFEEMEIVETHPRYLSREVLEEAKKNDKNCKIKPGGRELLNYEMGIPFPFPKTALELLYDCLFGYISYAPQLSFEPFIVTDYDSSGKVERTRKANLYVMQCMARQGDNVGEKHVLPGYKYGDIYEWGSLNFIYPQDMRGLSFVRTRYWDINKPDKFVGYIPAMRRIRTLSGADAQDPIAGSEYTWDMWGGEWQKQPSDTIFPNDYKLLGEKTILTTVYLPRPGRNMEGDQMQGLKWEKRRVYVLEIISRDPSYYYSKRIAYIDKEVPGAGVYLEYYDRRGELWRTWIQGITINMSDGMWYYDATDIVNWVDKRRSVQIYNSNPNPGYITPDYFKLKFLARQVR